jgi:hypothetical protein
MGLSTLLVVWLTGRFEGASPWLLALSPALALYVPLNWDMSGILLTVGALWLFRRRRPEWGMLALSAAIWVKLFPVVIVPLVLLDRLLARRRGEAARLVAIFATASLAFNAPFALEPTPDGFRLRESLLHFFRFNRDRPAELNLWNFFDGLGLGTPEVNLYSGGLLVAGIGVIMALIWRASTRRPGGQGDFILPAALAAIGWFFFINKVYSPQYNLWVVVLLALMGAPLALAASFASVDARYFVASFVILHFAVNRDPTAGWLYEHALWPATVLREAILLAIVVWSTWRILRPRRGTPLHLETRAEPASEN